MESYEESLVTDNDLTTSQLSAIKTIQKITRQKKALRTALAEHQWKIFADFDTRDEAEMLHLAVFMQSLLDNVPDAEGNKNVVEKNWESQGSIPSTMQSEIDDIVIDADSRNLEIAVADDCVHGDFEDYDVGKANITKEVAMQVIGVYKKGGRLSVKLVMKLLRTAYRMLKQAGNISRIDVPEGSKLTVVGDLHGQLPDLLHILAEAGLPADDNRYIFNGDFVDRGAQSVECICILLALYASDPQNVVLNRGNHEDIAINRVYGFQAECVDKYGELAYGMFCEVFRYLPLFVVANEDIFVVHGGLFHDAAVKLADLEEIDRLDYVTRPAILYPENTEGMSREEARKEYLKQLQRDALWSDPMEEEGVEDNPRGAGVCFGPDITETFMKNNKISMVIRSHECVRNGFCLHYQNDFETNICHPGVPLVCTIFSASNYCNGDNFGAYVTILPHKFSESTPVADCGLYYAVHRFKTSAAETSIEATNRMSLSALITRKKNALRMSFQAIDKENMGLVTRGEWADVMMKVTGIKIRWLAIMKSLVPADALTLRTVDYIDFLASFTQEELAKPQDAPTDSGGLAMMDAMYVQRKKLETVFFYFDTNNDGRISREEFHRGCAMLNGDLSENSEQRLTDIDHTLDLMDFDGSDDLDINEFFEVFRILDAKDGKVDGVLSLAQGSKKSGK
eukprot:CAMPEP_0119033936 /NCGR_PEP_ID=MMETSP1177-20130426/1001_1 /TAXON_ID=2985 /ORGANISM="Ochromonas sp, Strain CCMP1899" /LENGTH=680 /DNA_ID=CAMNT_0006991067 /DNA_START=153 /DNA_END=2195 /DNA_ORIENTATION=-